MHPNRARDCSTRNAGPFGVGVFRWQRPRASSRRSAQVLGCWLLKVELENVTHAYGSRALPPGRRPALSVRGLSIESGEHVCLVGRSGSGKTTLLNVLSGVLVPTSGRVRLGHTDLFALSEPARDALRARSIGCVFQTLNLLGGLSAQENLTLAQRFAG